MTHDERISRYCQLIGSMSCTLETAQKVLSRYRPKFDSDKRELAWLQDSIGRALAEERELFPGTGGRD